MGDSFACEAAAFFLNGWLGWCIPLPWILTSYSELAFRNVTGVCGRRWIQPGKKKKNSGNRITGFVPLEICSLVFFLLGPMTLSQMDKVTVPAGDLYEENSEE